jgi:signal transduction histidine kinase
MSLSLRGLFISFPIVALVVSGMAFSTYRSAIADYREEATSEILDSNDDAAQQLRRQLALVSATEHRAAGIMIAKLGDQDRTAFEDIFEAAPDGAYHTRKDLWEGAHLPGSVTLRGVGGFVAPPHPAGERKAALLAAFDTMKAMANGLPDEIESLYFFSPDNDLLIYAPKRPDKLSFYRSAPAVFSFQSDEFSLITSPKANPSGAFRCTSLQKPSYDRSGENWTTGCMLPVRVNGRHLGAWGVSIPLKQLTRSLGRPAIGATTIIVSGDGKLIHHSGIGDRDSELLQANMKLSVSQDPMLRELSAFLGKATSREVEYSAALGAYISQDRIAAPDWSIVTVLPEQALAARALSIAKRVTLVALIGAFIMGLILSAIFHSTIGKRLSRLVSRTDTIAASSGMTIGRGAEGDEIRTLEMAFDKMEERLQQARSREDRSFDALVDATKEYAMALFDDQGALVRTNEGASLLLGPAAIEALSGKYGLSPDATAMLPLDLLPGEEPRTFERELPDGRTMWLEETLIPLLGQDGERLGTAYIAHNLTALRASQREAEKTLLYLQLAQSSAQAGHFAFDPASGKISLSPWLQQRLGIESATITLAEVPALIAEEHRMGTLAALGEAVTAQTEIAVETVATGSGGLDFPVILHVTPIFENEGGAERDKLVGFYGIVQDISDRKEAADAVLRALDEAKAEARARSDILAVISHEVRTPLAGILGLIDQIRRERSDVERSRALTLIEQSSEALLATLDATLERTKAEGAKRELADEIFAPSELVERVAELFRPLARRKGLALDVTAAAGGNVLGQPGRIRQIMANFVSNAVKFTSSGCVTVSCTPPEQPGGIWVFGVADTGSGIAPQRMKTLFEPFSGSAPDTLGRQSGSGLGLSITRELAAEIGGSVEAHQLESGGTHMILRVALKQVEPENAGARSEGTIVIALSQASLAIKAEVIAAELGYALIDPEASGAVDIVLSDDPDSFAPHAAVLEIEVVADGEIERRGRRVRVPMPLLNAELANLIGSLRHG